MKQRALAVSHHREETLVEGYLAPEEGVEEEKLDVIHVVN
jgi:hypothetical protein